VRDGLPVIPPRRRRRRPGFRPRRLPPHC
jgi:hypothetical protein